MEQLVGNVFLFGLLFVFIYFVMIRPNKRARAEHQRLIESIEVGDEVITGGGMFGTVRAVGDEEVELEVSPGTKVRFLKSVIARRVTEGLQDDTETETELETENA